MIKFIKKHKIYALTFIIPILLYFIILFVKHIYPFGNIANIAYDENLQYEQFFNFYYNVLHGSSNIDYSLYKSLGGSLVGLWGYYLASPINLILLFFNEMNVLNFVFLATSIKIGLCSLFFAVFIKYRFKKLKDIHVLMLAVAYSFTQYVVGQMANIMWLDGVYMLPLLLYFTEKYLNDNKKLGLYITFILTIIFNWYTGYMNCLFTFIYFVYRLICIEHDKNKHINKLNLFKKIVKFGFIELLSVLGSAVIFLPIVISQLNSRSFSTTNLFEFSTNGSFFNIFRGFMIGSENPSTAITLYCSIFSFILIFYYIFFKSINSFEKKATLTFVLIMVFSLFLRPLENIWVGMSYEGSFQYRFLYVCILTVLLLPAAVLNKNEKLDKELVKKIIFGFIFAFLAFDLLIRFNSKRLWLQIVILLLYYFLICLFKKDKFKMPLIFTLFMFEILINAYLLVGNSYTIDKDYYLNYSANEKKMINQIKNSDNDFYRIETNIDRDIKRNSFISNESLAYSYSTIEQYTSTYDKTTGYFLANLGYSRNVFPTFYHEPILPADSLLGVKYLLTDVNYDGFELRKEFNSYNGKKVYENEYALSLGMNSSSDILKVKYNGNPFEYINEIYSGILGRDIQLFKPYDITANKIDSLNYEYNTNQDNNSNIIYFRFNLAPSEITIKRDNNLEEKYESYWLTHNVLVLGNDSEKHTLKVKNIDKSKYELQFYSFDLELFESIISEIKENSINFEKIEDGNIKFIASGEYALLTIPYSDSWNITIDGKKTEPLKGADGLLVIPLSDEVNHVDMKYKVKGKELGLFVTILSACVFTIFCIFDNKLFNKKVNS